MGFLKFIFYGCSWRIVGRWGINGVLCVSAFSLSSRVAQAILVEKLTPVDSLTQVNSLVFVNFLVEGDSFIVLSQVSK